MDFSLSFHYGFERAKSQADLLRSGVNLSRMDMNKVVDGGDLVDEVEPAAET